MNSKICIAFLLVLGLVLPAFAAEKPAPSDDALIDLVRRKLASDPVVKGGALEVDVKQGVVLMRGKVETQKQKERAAKLARKVKGVKGVTNELVVGR
ncbi:MAG: BON domain-containing protein [Bryobacteraceae bacterium]